MSSRALLAALACTAALAAPAGLPASVSATSSSQVAWVRSAASNFVRAELSANGASACAILYAPLRASYHHRTCAQRWDAKLATMLGQPATRAALHADMGAIPSARVAVNGTTPRSSSRIR